MKKIIRDFFSEEKRDFKFKIGSLIASALSGFVGGLIVATVVFMVFRHLEIW